MPNSEPTNVSISPKAISTELSITPVGGTMKPAVSSTEPKITNTTAHASCAPLVLPLLLFSLIILSLLVSVIKVGFCLRLTLFGKGVVGGVFVRLIGLLSEDSQLCADAVTLADKALDLIGIFGGSVVWYVSGGEFLPLVNLRCCY